MSVILFGEEVGTSHASWDRSHSVGYPWTSDLGTYPCLLTSGGHSSLETYPPPTTVLTSNSGHQNTCVWQAGDMHSTGMHQV